MSKQKDSKTAEAKPELYTVLSTVPYQCCPVCNGIGETVADGFTSAMYQTCKVCLGEMIIPIHILPQGNEALYITHYVWRVLFKRFNKLKLNIMAGINFTDEREYSKPLTFKNNDVIHVVIDTLVCDITKGTRCKDSFPNYRDGVCYVCGGQAN